LFADVHANISISQFRVMHAPGSVWALDDVARKDITALGKEIVA
jgi:hypothetical protein